MLEDFMVGASKVKITPKVGVNLFGYNPDTISDSVNDDLTATVIAMKQGSVTVLFVSVSVCLFETKLSEHIRKMLSDVSGVAYENIILSATHTHTGPCTASMEGWGDIDTEYCESILFPQLLDAAKNAILDLRSAKMGVGTTQSNIGMNRRQLLPEGSVILGQNPWGHYDDTLTVISFVTPSGDCIANLVHYGAHCTAAGNITAISRDWAGVMEDRLERISGGVTAFFNGAEGDVGPRIANGLTMGDITYAMELGGLAAHDASRAFRSIKDYRTPQLNVTYGTLNLPYDEVISLEEAEAGIEYFAGKSVNLGKLSLVYYQRIKEAYENGMPEEKHLSLQQTIVALDNVAFIPFSFELFSDIALRLKEYSSFEHTLCLGCTNGAYGYLPSEEQLCRGGYEVDMFCRGLIPGLRKDTDKTIINENLKIMEEISCIESGKKKSTQ